MTYVFQLLPITLVLVSTLVLSLPLWAYFVQQFVHELANAFSIGETRIGIVNYNLNAETLTELNVDNTAAAVSGFIDAIQVCPAFEPHCWTNTPEGLNAMNSMFSGMRLVEHTCIYISTLERETTRLIGDTEVL